MIISGSIQANSMLAEPFMVKISESYFSNSTGRNEADAFSEKVFLPNNI